MVAVRGGVTSPLAACSGPSALDRSWGDGGVGSRAVRRAALQPSRKET